HGDLNDLSAPYRSWLYSATNGQFYGMIDENFNNFEFTYDPAGNPNGKFQNRDASTQVTHTAFFAPVPGGDPSDPRMTAISVAPAQGNVQKNDGMFSYDTKGRLVQRTGETVPEAPGGPVTTYTYTTGTETPVGARRGGTATPTGDRMPVGLLRST